MEAKDQSSLVDKSPEKSAISFRDSSFQAYIDWLERNFGEEASQRTAEKIVKMMLKAESKWQIAAMKLFIKGNSERGDAFFDKAREVVVGIAQSLPKYPLFKEQGVEKQTEIQRWLFSTYVSGLLDKARGNEQLDASLRGIAWSLMAKDAREVLTDSRQLINSDWLFKTMGPLIMANTEPIAINEQLSRFKRGDPEVVSAHLSS